MNSHLVRRTVTILAVACALVVAGAGVASADPAAPAAAAARSACPVQEICLWPDAGFRGGFYHNAGWDEDFTLYGRWAGCIHVGFNDCASSAFNHGQHCTVYLWTDINFRGRYHSLGAGDFVSNFASPDAPPAGFSDPSFNDQVSSLYWCRPRP